MEYALEERIGKPELFTGRQKEMVFFLNWINDIKERKSQSTAILARRKMGKTAIMERLFNITFYKNDGIIPFYYEIKEKKMWIGDFCQEFFLTFIYQYIAFKSRKTEYLAPLHSSDFEKTALIAKKEGLDYLCDIIENAAHALAHEQIDILWEIVRNAPQAIAFRRKEFIVQMIDEFQFLNVMFYRDKEMKILVDDLAGGYLSTAESKIAPLLVSGSWVGWLMNILVMMLPGRLKYKYLGNMPEDEAVEVVFNYSRLFEVPVTDEIVFYMIHILEGNPFYLTSLIRSECKDKNLTNIDGLTRVLEYETLDDNGVIKITWIEYLKSVFNRVDKRDAKRIVLFLYKHSGREFTRKDLLDGLKLEMSDKELEEKMEALVKADVINQGSTKFKYRFTDENIFAKVFSSVYQKEIEYFDATIR